MVCKTVGSAYAVRTLHLPLPAKTAPGLWLPRPAGRLLVVAPGCIVCRRGVPCRSGYGHIADGSGADGAVHGTAGSGRRPARSSGWVAPRTAEDPSCVSALCLREAGRALRDGRSWASAAIEAENADNSEPWVKESANVVADMSAMTTVVPGSQCVQRCPEHRPDPPVGPRNRRLHGPGQGSLGRRVHGGGADRVECAGVQCRAHARSPLAGRARPTASALRSPGRTLGPPGGADRFRPVAVGQAPRSRTTSTGSVPPPSTAPSVLSAWTARELFTDPEDI
jgi:hypothetical protein